MSNKTALQEALELIDKECQWYYSALNNQGNYTDDAIIACKTAVTDLEKIKEKIKSELLEKEKQQIMEAWLNERDMTWINSNGEDATIEDLKPNAEDYYNSKYGNNGTTNKKDR
ncbi:hypothetical protein [Elizabethkingia anophelis]|uniref:hypothetical protein n=1 Tax=Elizabethkingia anophelis TaxID=1117645 RepID=UPI002013B36C|nr:hypothetical protein [Elizabethkingia anophelis]MCL1692030.1 hypothetical protein [Elizabethkingia anophelis]